MKAVWHGWRIPEDTGGVCVSAAGKFLLDRVAKNFSQFAFKATRDVTEVKLAELGNDAGAYGAASLARNSNRTIA